jgi:hypothetical protein
MKQAIIVWVACTACLFAASAWAAAGELWEVTSKTEMAGMPFAMPANTQQVCLPKGGANDPRQSTPDKDCQMTDIRTVGSKTVWKVHCNHNGEVMNGTGEITSNADSYHGVVRLNGKSEGETVNMTMNYSGRRLGKSCDADQVSKITADAQRQIARSCELSGQGGSTLIYQADMYLGKGATCAGKRDAFCNQVRGDVARDPDAYGALATYGKGADSGRVSVASACRINMAATTRSICKTLDGNNYKKLAAYCPAEAKAYRVSMRNKECEGRGYTSHEDLANCMTSGDGSGGNMASVTAGGGSGDGSGSNADSNSGSGNPAAGVIDAAKKLKGFFGF